MEIYSNTTRFALACNMSNKIIEPIQSRCAILRYSKLRDAEVMKRLQEICAMEKVQFNEQGLGALIFTAEGDMRQAINNLQSTWSGFGFVSQDNVYKICDQPHPQTIRKMVRKCQDGDIDGALEFIHALWDQGYSAVDIVVTLFRVIKSMDDLAEYTKLEFIRVGCLVSVSAHTAGGRMDAHARSRGCRNSRPARRHDLASLPHEPQARPAQVVVYLYASTSDTWVLTTGGVPPPPVPPLTQLVWNLTSPTHGPSIEAATIAPTVAEARNN